MKKNRNNMDIENILVVRFRQMGDAVLTTVICNTLRQNFPEARIDYVLNTREEYDLKSEQNQISPSNE